MKFVFLLVICVFVLDPCYSRIWGANMDTVLKGDYPSSDSSLFPDFNRTIQSWCAGRIINMFTQPNVGYLEAFEECEKNRPCGCVSTCDGVDWKLHEETYGRPSTYDDFDDDPLCQTWVYKCRGCGGRHCRC